MDILAQPKTITVQCTLCKKDITPDKTIAGIGYVGPECYKKVSGFNDFLEKYNLTDAVEGGLVISDEELKVRSKELNRLCVQFKKAGFGFESSKSSDGIRIRIFADSRRGFAASAKRLMAVAA
jgi:hypothetical protein